MNCQQIIIFPGLDGTDLLLDRFCEIAPAAFEVKVLAIPDDPADDYKTLCDHFSNQIEQLESCHIIAESFSGPLGILLANRFPNIVARLTLVATFATSPTPFAARVIPWSIVFRLPMPSLVARHFFVGKNRALIKSLKNAVKQTSAQTLAQRMQCLTQVDVTQELSALTCKLDYIRPTKDRLVSLSSLSAILKANPAVLVHKIEGPHLIMQSQPDAVWQAILISCE